MRILLFWVIVGNVLAASFLGGVTGCSNVDATRDIDTSGDENFTGVITSVTTSHDPVGVLDDGNSLDVLTNPNTNDSEQTLFNYDYSGLGSRYNRLTVQCSKAGDFSDAIDLTNDSGALAADNSGDLVMNSADFAPAAPSAGCLNDEGPQHFNTTLRLVFNNPTLLNRAPVYSSPFLFHLTQDGPYAVGGKVAGLGSGLSVVLQNNNNANHDEQGLTNSGEGFNGLFAFAPMKAGTPYSIKIVTQPTNQICTFDANNGTTLSGTVGAADVSLGVTCGSIFVIRGTVQGLGLGLSLTLQNNDNVNGDAQTLTNSGVSFDGHFAFAPMKENSPYSLKVVTQPSHQICTFDTNHDTILSGTLGTSDISIGVTCLDDAIKISPVALPGKTYTLHQYGKPWNTECRIDRGTLTSNTDQSDLICILEGLELDFFSFDGAFKLNYNVPKDMCKYVKVFPYYFYQKQGGIGPSAVSMTVTTSPTGPSINQITGQTIVTPGITAQLDDKGNLFCTANHTSGFFQANCCEGDYVLTKTQDANPPTTEQATWGGVASNCLVGPAVATQAKDLNGFPKPDHIDMAGISLNQDYEIVSPESLNYSTNLYISDFFDLSSALDPDGKTFHYAAAPAAIRGPQDPLNLDQPFDDKADHHNAWYEFGCLDQADDYIYRVRLMIRSWSTQQQFDMGEAGSFDLGSGGAEEVYFKQEHSLDRCGWFDATGGKCGVLGNLLDDPLAFPGDNL